MTDQTVKFDTAQARQDLDAFAKALDKTAASATKMDGALSTAVTGLDRSVTKAAKSLEGYAQVLALVNKLKLSSDPGASLRALAGNLSAIGSVRVMSGDRLLALKEFFHVINSVKGAQNVAGISRTISALSGLGSLRVPSTTSVQNLRGFFRALDSYKGTPPTAALQRFFGSLTSLKVPSSAQIARLKEMFTTLASAKAIPNAQRIAADLDMISSAAARAAHNLGAVRAAGGGRGLGIGGGGGGGRGSGGGTPRASGGGGSRGYASVSLSSLDALNGRLKLGYQLGTAFSAVFSAFTIGAFVRNIYDAEVQTLKFQKAMVFVTGTFDGAQKATEDFIAISNDLGLNFEKNADAIGRFTIAAHAAGASVGDVKQIFTGATTALQVAGASAQQTQYAFYGLAQMMSKGHIQSKEFNRQVGEQIPGNVAAGIRALSQLEGHIANGAELFDKMRKGQLESLPFLKAWSTELGRMFDPLKGLIQSRPDVAVNRLSTAFFSFRKATAESGFTGAFVNVLNGLTSKISDSTGHLTADAQRLADSLGKGLGNAVHALGQGLQFLFDHMSQVAGALKAVAVISIASTVAGWTKSFFTFAGSVRAATLSLTTFQKAQFTNMGAGFGKMSGNLGAMSNIALANTGRARVARRLNFGAAGPALQTGVALGGLVARQAGGALAGAAEGVAGAAMGGLSMALGTLPLVATAAAVAVAFFGDNVVKLGAKLVTVNDIVGSGLSMIGKALLDMLNDFGPLGGLKEMTAGDWIARLVAGIVTIVKALVGASEVITGAAMLAGGMGKTSASEGMRLQTAGMKHLREGMNFQQNYQDVVTGSVSGAEKRTSQQAADIATTTMDKQVEAILEQRRREDEALTAQGQMDSLRREAMNGGKGLPTFDDVIKNVTQDQANFSLGLVGRGAKAGTPDTAAETIKTGAQKAGDVAVSAARTAAQIQIDAAREAAFIQQKKENSNTIAAGLGVTGGVLKTGASQEVKDAIQAAAKTGVNEDVLTAIASFETGDTFDPHARNRKAGSSASGLYQFNYDTAREFGLTTATSKQAYLTETDAGQGGAMNALSSALAEAALIQKRNDEFKKIFGRDMNGGEAYGAHFLGVGQSSGGVAGSTGLSRLVWANAKTPNADAASLFPNLVAGNPALFKPGMTASGLYQRFAQIVPGNGRGAMSSGASAAVSTGSLTGALSGDGEESIDQKFNKVREEYEALLKGINPGRAAVANLNDTVLKLDSIEKTAKDLSAKAGLPAFMEPQAIAELRDRMTQEAKDKINPISHENRLAQETNDLVAMRLKGAGTEADWQEKLNALKEQGYIISNMDLKATRERYEALKDQTDLLRAQGDLRKAQNEAQVSRIQKTGRGEDYLFAQSVLREGKPGETYDETLKRLQPTGVAANLQATARVQAQSQVETLTKQTGDSFAEAQATKLMSTAAVAYRNDFKKYLQDLTGSASDSMQVLLSLATEGESKLAQQWAQQKNDFENPPGFEKWARGLEPLSKRLEDIKASFAEDLSSSLTDALSGDKVDWRGMVHNLSKQVLKAEIDSAMAGIIGQNADGKGLSGTGAGQFFGRMFGGRSSDELAKQSGVAGAHGGRTLDQIGDLNPANVGERLAATAKAEEASVNADLVKMIAQTVVVQAASISAQGDTGGEIGGYTGEGGINQGDFAGGQGNDIISALAAGDSGADASAVAGGPGGIDIAGTPTIPAGEAIGGSVGGGSIGAGKPLDLGALFSAANDNIGGPPAGAANPASGGLVGGLGAALNGATGGLAGKAGNFLNGATGGLLGDVLSPLASGVNFVGGALNTMSGGTLGKLGSSLAGAFTPQLGIGILSAITSYLTQTKQKPVTDYQPVKGVIGESRGVSVAGTQVAGHSNIIGDILTMVATAAINGGMNGGGGQENTMSAPHTSIREGGYTTSPIAFATAPISAWNNAPHWREGTASTDGIPAIVHPNEAVIPLSRGRKIPVDLGGVQQPNVTIHSPVIVYANDANSFRQSDGSIARGQDRVLRRAAARNLTGSRS